MVISQIDILRDGGTILFEIADDTSAGKYRLQTPFKGMPQPLFKNEQRLDFGSEEEAEVASKLKGWLAVNLTEELEQSLAELDQLKIWRNPSAESSNAIPFYRIRHVLQVLKSRLRE